MQCRQLRPKAAVTASGSIDNKWPTSGTPGAMCPLGPGTAVAGYDWVPCTARCPVSGRGCSPSQRHDSPSAGVVRRLGIAVAVCCIHYIRPRRQWRRGAQCHRPVSAPCSGRRARPPAVSPGCRPGGIGRRRTGPAAAAAGRYGGISSQGTTPRQVAGTIRRHQLTGHDTPSGGREGWPAVRYGSINSWSTTPRQVAGRGTGAVTGEREL